MRSHPSQRFTPFTEPITLDLVGLVSACYPLGMDSSPAAVYVPLDALRPWPANPRSHRVEDLVRSIKRFGFGAPILARSNGEVIAGHGRLEAARALGLVEVPVRYLDLPEGEAHALALADNQLGGAWTEDLGEVVKDLADRGVDLDGLGWGKEDLDALMGREAEDVDDPGAEEPREKADSRPGELYELGPHRLLCGDSTKPEDVGRLFVDGAGAGLMATDPPYGVSYNATKDGIPGSGFRDQLARWEGDIAQDDLDGPHLQAFLESCFRAILPHLDHAAWYLWHAHLTQGFFAAAAAAAAADVLLHRQIIWRKSHMVLTRSGQYHWQHEPAFYGWVRGQPPAWYSDASQTSVWDVPHDTHGDRVHPTQKPVALFEIPIRNHLRPSEVCYEPFAGSGTQLIAAARCGVVCRAIEIEPRFCDVIRRRWTAWARLAGQDPGPGHLDPSPKT